MRRLPVSCSIVRSMVSICLGLACLGAPSVLPVSAHTGNAVLPTLYWSGLTGTTTWVDSLDPANVTGGNGGSAIQLVDANLVQILPDGKVAPQLATWKVSRDHRTYTFFIRPNARFSNGDPVTAQDVKYSLTRLLLPKTNSTFGLQTLHDVLGAKRVNAGKATTLQGVRVLNTRTVSITIDRPVTWFLGNLSTINADILDQRVVQGHKPGSYLTQTCSANVGAGPFMFVCRNKDTGLSSFYPPGTTPSMTFVPNPYFYGRKPHIRIVERDMADSDANYLAYEAGQVDEVGSIPSAHIAATQGKPGFARVLAPYIWYFAPNLQQPPMNNLHCRLAFMYAIDQDTINNKVLRGTVSSLYSVVPKGILGWYPGANNPHYNPARARAELAQCPGGLHHLVVPYWKTGTDADNTMAAIQNMLAQVGITATIKPLQFNDWLTIINQPLPKTNTAIILTNWVAGVPDASQFFATILLPGSPSNCSNYSDPTVNRLRLESDVTFNPRKRARLLEEMSHIVLSHAGMMPIGQQAEYALIKPYVHGFVKTAFNAWGTLYVPKHNDWANVSISPH